MTHKEPVATDTSGSAELGDDVLRDAIALANIPVLLLLLTQMTGDPRWMRDPYRPSRNEGLDDNASGGLEVTAQQEVRDAAWHAIRAYLDGAPLAIPEPSQEQLVEMLAWSMAESIPVEYGAMLAAELGLLPDRTEAAARKVPAGFDVLVIGAGLSGVAMSAALKRVGIPFTVIERASDVGGSWLHNQYPGCGVDTPSAIYSFSFTRWPWSRYFALRDEVEEYLRDTARTAGVYPHIRFGEEVTSARYDPTTHRWSVQTRGQDGTQEYSASVVISAVGAFSTPKLPQIPGLDTFAGEVVHTAEWPEGLDLTGRRVAVIGNGASAMQVVPAIADRVEHMTVFQRAPHWIAPFEKFGAEVPPVLRQLAAAVPLYQQWYRIRWAWTFNDRLHPSLQKDPNWEHPTRAVSAQNDRHRAFFTSYLERELVGRPDLIESLTPDYPPFGKRILLDNGWYRALRRDNVELVSERVDHIDDGDLITTSGRRIEADLLVCATGFDVVQFLAPMQIVGRSGTPLREFWEGDNARAYLGTVVPDFPNFLMMYGPNVQPGHGGSLVGMAEIQVHYILDLFGQMFDQKLVEFECREDVWANYNLGVDAAHEKMVWTHPGMSTYYRNSRGRVVVPSPYRVVDTWHMARHADLADFTLTPAG